MQKMEKLQVRRQDVSRRYHEQEIGVFVGTCPISAPGAPCNKTKQIQKDPYDSKGYTHTPPRREACFKLRAKRCGQSSSKARNL